MAVDLGAIGANLRLSQDGVWRALNGGTVDYPNEGNALCFAVEDDSWWFRHRNACLVDTSRRFPPGAEVFDIGAGNGAVAAALEGAGFPTVIVEPGPAGIRHARQRGLTNLVESTLQDAGFRDRALTAVGMFDVIEHLADDVGTLHELHRLMPPAARLYITVPAFSWLWSRVDEVSGHHRRYTLAILRDRLAVAGFDVEWGTYFFAPMPLPILLTRTLPGVLRPAAVPLPSVVAASLTTSSTLTRLALNLWSTVELAWLRTGRALIVGSSCLIVARRT